MAEEKSTAKSSVLKIDDKASKPKSPKEKKPKDKSPSEKGSPLAIIGIILLILGLIGGGALVFINLTRGDDTEGKIKVDDVNPETAKELSGQLVYSGGQEEVDYYSPVLDVVFQYPQQKIVVDEGYDYVGITPRGETSIYGKLLIHSKSEITDPQTYYEQKYKDYYDDVTAEKKDNLDGGITKTLIKYTRESVLEGETETVYRYILGREIGDSYAVIDINEVGGTDLMDEYMDDYAGILSSVNTNTQGISADILAKVKDGGVEVKIDRKKWEISSSSDSYLSLGFLSNKYEENKEYEWATTSVIIMTGMAFTDDPVATIKNDLKSELDSNSDYYKSAKKEFKVVEDLGETKIDNITFYYTEYEVETYDGKDIVRNYKGYNPANEYVVSITTHNPGADSVGAEEINTVLSNITISDEKTTEETQEGMSFSGAAVMGTSSVEIDKAAVIGEPSVVHIYNKSCVTVKVASSPELPYSGGQSYDVCSLAYGSGFYVNKDGYVVTNAHVAALNPLDVVVIGAMGGYDPNNFGGKLVYDVVSMLIEMYPEFANADPNDPNVQQQVASALVAVIVTGSEEGVIDIGEPTYENYVQGDEVFELSPFNGDLESLDKHMTAELIDRRDIDSLYKIELESVQKKETGITQPDLAVLKVDGSSGDAFPAIPLLDPDKLNLGESIYVIGFPGAAEGEGIFAESSTTIPTITRGTISAIKRNFNEAFDLVQIDASISHGNSGGPIVNADGNLVGVATYGINLGESADFNAGVSVEEVEKLLKDNDVSLDVGNVTEEMQEGLDNLSMGYYKWAVENFKKAKSESSLVDGVLDPLIEIAQEKINQGEDNSPVFTVGGFNIHKSELIIGGAVLGCLILGGFLVFVFRGRKPKGPKAPKGGKVKVGSNVPPVASPTPGGAPAVGTAGVMPSATPVSGSGVTSQSASSPVSTAQSPVSAEKPKPVPTSASGSVSVGSSADTSIRASILSKPKPVSPASGVGSPSMSGSSGGGLGGVKPLGGVSSVGSGSTVGVSATGPAPVVGSKSPVVSAQPKQSVGSVEPVKPMASTVGSSPSSGVGPSPMSSGQQSSATSTGMQSSSSRQGAEKPSMPSTSGTNANPTVPAQPAGTVNPPGPVNPTTPASGLGGSPATSGLGTQNPAANTGPTVSLPGGTNNPAGGI